MKFTRLRLSGFKSFVEPTEFIIERGLTGIVGPNGCGKSNLLEAIRWVMGETSHKSMRASGMDDVIFSGTSTRPSRNMAEVVLSIENDSRTAPVQFNAEHSLEIMRRIERESGSAYRINGKDVRARDVQLFFADASTGSRSPALVRQGQISEIINAKPQARRLILEEAAGITGLHTRRHEAELKLRAAEQNLLRLDDVLAQLETQLAGLKRQSRHALKYREISATIRKLEAQFLYGTWALAAAAEAEDFATLDTATRALAEATRLASVELRASEEATGALPKLRENEAVRAAVLTRLELERQTLDQDEARALARQKELEDRLAQINGDLSRAHEAVKDTADTIARLGTEQEALAALEGSDTTARTEAAAIVERLRGLTSEIQEAADAATARLSELNARSSALFRARDDQRARLAKSEAELGSIRREKANLAGAEGSDLAALGLAVEMAVAAVATSDAHISTAEGAVRTARQAEAENRTAYDAARRQADQLETEVRTLTKLLQAAGGDLWPSLLDSVSVRPGYETALAAALGDEIEASADEAAPLHWRHLPVFEPTAPLPEGAEPLMRFVDAPHALSRSLTHVGVVTPNLGRALQSQLQPGQRLVSKDGASWRWDGYTAAADAPSAAARRLAERNRLEALGIEARSARHSSDAARMVFDAAHAAVEQAVTLEREARENGRATQAAADVARRALQLEERQTAERSARIGALDEAERRLAATHADVDAGLSGTLAEITTLAEPAGLEAEVQRIRADLARERNAHAEARARADGLEREAKMRLDRLAAIAQETAQWQARAGRSSSQINQLTDRVAETRASLLECMDAPKAFGVRRQALLTLLQEADAGRRAAADARIAAENTARMHEQGLRQTQEQVSEQRAAQARAQARLEAATARHTETRDRIQEVLHCTPEDVPRFAGFDPSVNGISDDTERRLAALRDERERLGGVNLRADDEATEVTTQRDGLVAEKADLTEAINRLRGGIGSLNREGRQRLLDAFVTVNEKFGELFTGLFGGGRAELQLIESEDPLEAGLEILAHPPGKKPTTLSLLSGGEQTLTALSLIFAVFLTNPSPICVLDEVDAPLDDHNVERFCNLLDAMLERTQTRFLIITHHPLTMARMHRLFGVTMMERGVSQLVSVDLEQAGTILESA